MAADTVCKFGARRARPALRKTGHQTLNGTGEGLAIAWP